MSLEGDPTPHDLATIEPARLPDKPKMTLQDLIALMAVIDQADDLPDIDFEAMLGDLKDKVDDLNYVLLRMETVASFLKDYVAPINKKRASIERARERLRDYVAKSMRGDFLPQDQRQRIERIPGNVYFVRLRDNPPALGLKRPATAVDFEKYPNYVKMERIYSWRSDIIKHDLAAGHYFDNEGKAHPAAECEFAEITRGCWPEFKLQVPAVLEKKKTTRGAKKA